MDKKNLLMTGAAVVTLTAFGAGHAFSATEPVDIDATIVAAITLTEVDPLDFGINSVGAAGGTVLVNADGTFSRTGDVADQGRDPDNALVTVAGTMGVPIDLTIPAGPAVITSGANTMNVDSFNIDVNAGGESETITLTGASRNVPIGGTLTVGAAQASGIYSGTFTFNANYQ